VWEGEGLSSESKNGCGKSEGSHPRIGREPRIHSANLRMDQRNREKKKGGFIQGNLLDKRMSVPPKFTETTPFIPLEVAEKNYAGP